MGKKVDHIYSKEKKNSNSSPFIKGKNSGIVQRIAQHVNVRSDLPFWIPILQKRKAFLTQLITKKSNQTFKHDFRFLIPLAHRLMEQGGFDKGNVELNNPYYLRSKGDLGYKVLTKDEAKGKVTGKFGKFSTEEKGVEAYFERLENNTHKDGDKTWTGAYDAILKGTSFQDFIRGLQPDGNVAIGRNYSTKYTYNVPKDKEDTPTGKYGTMMGGMKFRLTNLIQDFITINTFEIKQIEAEIAKNEEEDFYDSLDRISYLETDNELLQKSLQAILKNKEVNIQNSN